MAIKQTRRTVSMNRALFDAITSHCKAQGVAVSAWIHAQAVDGLRREGAELRVRRGLVPRGHAGTDGRSIHELRVRVAHLADEAAAVVGDAFKAALTRKAG